MERFFGGVLCTLCPTAVLDLQASSPTSALKDFSLFTSKHLGRWATWAVYGIFSDSSSV